MLLPALVLERQQTSEGVAPLSYLDVEVKQGDRTNQKRSVVAGCLHHSIHLDIVSSRNTTSPLLSFPGISTVLGQDGEV